MSVKYDCRVVFVILTVILHSNS